MHCFKLCSFTAPNLPSCLYVFHNCDVVMSIAHFLQLHLNEEEYEIDHNEWRSYFHMAKIEPRLLPSIQTSYKCSCTGILNLWGAIETASQHNQGSALFTFGAVVMNLHFQTMVELKGGAQVVVLYGEADVGKTTYHRQCGNEHTRHQGMQIQRLMSRIFHSPCIKNISWVNVQWSKQDQWGGKHHHWLYNGMTRGGFKRGLETPQCGFTLACNFSLERFRGKYSACNSTTACVKWH